MPVAEAEEPLLVGARAGEEGRRRWWAADGAELKVQVQFAVPMVLTNASYYAIPLISVMFAGHLGDVQLAGSTLANSWATVTAFALLIGLSGALETFCGQNYGAKSYKMLGIQLQASMVISSLFSIIISMLWLYTEPILILLYQDLETSKMAATYLKHLIPGIFAYAFLQCMLRFLQTQSVGTPLVVCSLIPLILHVGLNYQMVYVWGLGFIGSPLSVGFSLWVSFLMMALYVKFSSRFKNTWGGLSMECIGHILPILKLAIPSALMVCLEFWAFEILVLLAGLMSNSMTSTSLIAMCVTTEAIIYTFTFGLSAIVRI